jgi:membrane-associated phospholipid phosphatase
LAFVGGALVAPLVLAPSGVDQGGRELFQRDFGGRHDAEAVTVAAPFALGAAAFVGYGVSLAAHDCRKASMMSRAVTSMGVSLALVSVMKLVVGRRYLTWYTPEGGDRLVDDGRATEVTPFSGFGAWPSGHAAVTFAFAAVVRKELENQPFAIRYLGYALAVSVSLGMAYGDHHWTSDLVSGALLGEAVGRTFGGRMSRSSDGGLVLVPTASGVAIAGSL